MGVDDFVDNINGSDYNQDKGSTHFDFTIKDEGFGFKTSGGEGIFKPEGIRRGQVKVTALNGRGVEFWFRAINEDVKTKTNFKYFFV